jgi:hypothetical protein
MATNRTFANMLNETPLRRPKKKKKSKKESAFEVSARKSSGGSKYG